MAIVSYIRECEAFIRRASDENITGQERLLYYALLTVFNARAQGNRWPDGFIEVANRTLLSFVPYGENALIEARNRLAQRGLVDYRKGLRNSRAPAYRMRYLALRPDAYDEAPQPHPPDEAQAFGVISWGTVAAAFSGATKIISKSPQEALGVPTAEANIRGLRCTRQVLSMFKEQQPLATLEIDREHDLITLETRQLLNAVERLGAGDLAVGTVRAFQSGALDVPFAPSREARGAVIPVRDLHGAIRILEFGNLAVDSEIKAIHRAFLEERAQAEGRAVTFQMVTDDIYAVSKGRLVGKPRSQRSTMGRRMP